MANTATPPTPYRARLTECANLPITETATILGLHRNTVRRLLAQGDLTERRYGRVRRVTTESILALLDRGGVDHIAMSRDAE